MKLTGVDIFGFKSFAERTELSFHRGVTAIVGPNGCGKSNISDAIGWALGEQSAKSLRGKKMEDFIFTGSDARPPVGVAEVNLRLSGVNGDPSGATRQVVVTRRLYRSGESEYLMDGSPCRLRDIHDIFMDTGVGTKSYSIIEQGKIGLILSSKPTDRRTLIEEAAGITKYKARRRSAELKLQAAQQNLLRVNDIVYEVERQMNSLKRQAGKARRYRRLRDAMSHLEKIAAVKKSREIVAVLDDLRAKLRAQGDEELRRSTSLVTTESYLERLRIEQADHETTLADVRERLHRIELTIERLENQMSANRRGLADLEGRRAQLDSEVEELEARYGPSLEQLRLRERDEVDVVDELTRREEEATLGQQKLARASLELAEAERQIEDGRGELVHRISKIAALKNFLQGVLTNSEKVASEILKLEGEMRELEVERDRVSRDRQELERELGRKQERASLLAFERGKLEDVVSALQSEKGRIETEMARKREELSTLTGRLESLEELMEERAHFRAGARHLLVAGSELGISLGGSVADAIDVAPRFERAAERYYGDFLQYVLVADEGDARTAKHHLEEIDAGQCDFLIESLVVASRRDRVHQALLSLTEKEGDGIVGALSEAVGWVNGKSELLSRALPDAVVTENLDDALQAFRLEPSVAYVTLGGDVVEPPGVLRAGPGGPSEGLLRTKREVRELRESLSRATEEVQDLERRRSSLLEELAAAETGLAGVKDEQHGVDKELVGLEHRRRQLDEERSRVERKSEVLASEQARSESERSALGAKRVEMEQSLAAEEESKAETEVRLDQLRASLSERRAGVERLQGKVAEEASQVAALRERAQAVRLDVERLREGVRELESRVGGARKEEAELQDRSAELRKDLVEAEKQIAESLAERGRHQAQTAKLDEAASQARGRAEVTETALKTRRRELEAVREAKSAAEVALAREESEMSHLRGSFSHSHGISLEDAAALLSPNDLAREDEELAAELEELKGKLDSIGPVNPMADEEYQDLLTRHEFLTTQRKDLLDSISSTETAIRRIDHNSRQRFQEAFVEINRHFDTTFRQLFGGGRASLSLIDEDDILESGVDINAQPPGKRLQNVLLLSGGEKALTAIALMFAIFRYKPSPFCVLDEVDAPLDDANVGRFLAMLEELRNATQFIVITHNRKTMEIADQMYGVTMEEPGISKLVSVKLVSGDAVGVGLTPS